MVFNMMNDMRSGIDIQILSPFQGEDYGGTPTGGYAALTPGYYRVTPTGFSVRIPAGFCLHDLFPGINIRVHPWFINI